jgi:hypothetical protein
MAVLFVSHASQDDALAGALETWLRAKGFTDLFIDHSSMAGGDKWRDALKASAKACRVVIFLVSPHWLASSECFGEFLAASYMGRRLIPLFLLPSTAALDDAVKHRLSRVRREDQGIDLMPCVGADGGRIWMRSRPSPGR